MRVFFTLITCGFLFLSTGCALSEKRVALVIGNSAYLYAAELTNPKNDATGVAKALQGLGFEVITGFDLTKREMERKISEFAGRLEDADVSLLFYAGHGLQVANTNYLVPVDARLKDEAYVDIEAVPVAHVRKPMELKAKKTLIFLDACRDNPLAKNLRRSLGKRSMIVGQGLVGEEKGKDTFISFSVQPGGQAEDGSGTNSPYTLALLRHIATPGQNTNDLMIKIRRDVLKQTKEHQNPWSVESFLDHFYFVADQTTEGAGSIKVRARPLINACDRLAANPDDPKKRGPGVRREAVDVKWAIPACVDAATQFRDEPRFTYQLGRAYSIFKQCERAKPLFEAAAAREYPIAFNDLGNLYSTGCGSTTPKNDETAISFYRKAADAGVVVAQYNLSIRYANGLAVSRDDAEALRLMTAAAEAGHSPAKRSLAGRYNSGRGVPESEETAVKLLREAAGAGDWSALTDLADQYTRGKGVSKDEAEAVRLYQKAATEGSPDALSVLGNIYQYGRGVPKNLSEALRYYQEASDAGSAGGTYSLANMFYYGRGVAIDRQESARLYRLAVEEGGHSGAIRKLADMLERAAGVPRNEAEAFRLYKLASDRGDLWSTLSVAQMLFTGRGTAKDEAAAAKLRLNISESADTYLLSTLASLFAEGEEAPKDDAEALRLYLKAAKLGNQEAIIELSDMYFKGVGAAKDEVESARLRDAYEAAAKVGYEFANLASRYEEGTNAPLNTKEAVRLYEISFAKGRKSTAISLARLYYDGPDGVKNEGEAERIRRGVADSEDAFTLARLAAMYETGNGAPRNEPDAAALYAKSLSIDSSASAALALARMLYDGRGTGKNETEATRLRDIVAAGSEVDQILKLARMYATGDGAPKRESQALDLCIVRLPN